MAQLKAGTVTVTHNSNVVTGSSTGWIAAKSAGTIKAGDLFHIPTDSTKVPYTILSISSSVEQITLSVPYDGSSVSGLGYAITYGWSPWFSLYLASPSDVDIVMLITYGLVAKLDGILKSITNSIPSWLSKIVWGTPTDGQVLTYDVATDTTVYKTPTSGGLPEAPTTVGNKYVRGESSWKLLREDFIDPYDYGLVFNSSNQTTVWQAAINAAQTAKKPLWIPPSNWGWTVTTLHITASIEIFGTGLSFNDPLHNVSKFTYNATTGDFFDIQTVEPVYFHDFYLTTNNTANTSGAAIRITGVGTEVNFNPRLEHLLFNGFYDGVVFEGVSIVRVDTLYMGNITHNCLTFNQNMNRDAGDNIVENLQLIDYRGIGTGTIITNAGIELTGGGYLTVTNSKFLFLKYGILLNNTDSNQYLNIGHCSFEENDIASISIQKNVKGSAYYFYTVLIGHNQFAQNYKNGVAIEVLPSANTDGSMTGHIYNWLEGLEISDNGFMALDSGLGNTFECFVKVNAGVAVNIANNTFNDSRSDDFYAIKVGPNVQCHIGDNEYLDFQPAYQVLADSESNVTRSMKLIGDPTATTTIYVDNTNGTDDMRHGKSTGTAAFRSIQYAIDYVSSLISGNVIIYPASGTYVENLVISGKFTGKYSLQIIGEVTSSSSFTATSPIQGSGVTHGSLIASITLFGGPTSYLDKWVRCTSGANSGQIRKIDYADGSNYRTIHIVGYWPNSIGSGDTFVIDTVAALIQPSSGYAITITNNSKVSMQNLKIVGTNTQIVVSAQSNVAFSYCTFGGNFYCSSPNQIGLTACELKLVTLASGVYASLSYNKFNVTSGNALDIQAGATVAFGAGNGNILEGNGTATNGLNHAGFINAYTPHVYNLIRNFTNGVWSTSLSMTNIDANCSFSGCTNNIIHYFETSKIGVNTTSPTETFDVNGVVKATQFKGDGSALTGMSGGRKKTYTGSSAYTILADDDYIQVNNGGAAGFTVSAPAVVVTGKVYTIYNAGSNYDISLWGNGLLPGDSATVVGIGGVWTFDTLPTDFPVVNDLTTGGTKKPLSAEQGKNLSLRIPTTTTGYIPFSVGSTYSSDSNLFWDNTNKRLGIGTSTPTVNTDIYSTTSVPQLLIRYEATSASGGGTVSLRHSNASDAYAVAGDRLGTVQYGSRSGGTNRNGVVISAYAEENFSASACGSNLSIRTVNIGTTSPTEKIRVSANGFIGVPTATAVASASTITPTGPVFTVTGTTTINTINLPYTGFEGTITLIKSDAGTLLTGIAGNIAIASTFVQYKALQLTYVASLSKWCPSY